MFSGLEGGTFSTPELITATGKRGNLITGDWNGDGASDLAWFVDTSKDTMLYTILGVDSLAEIPLPETEILIDPVVTTTEPKVSTPSNNFPAINSDAEPIETEGVIFDAGADYFVINGITIWYDSSATIKFEIGYGNTIDIGDDVQVEAYTNVDDSGTAKKIQIGPL